jgi:hypothetical protein
MYLSLVSSLPLLTERMLLCKLITSALAVELTLNDTLTRIKANESDEEVMREAHNDFLASRNQINSLRGYDEKLD